MPEVQELTPIQELYNSLSAKQPQIKERGFDGFSEDMKDDNNSKALFESLSKQQPEIGKRGYDGFKADMIGGSQPIQPENEQPLTYMQKELRQKFPENYTEEPVVAKNVPTEQPKSGWDNFTAGVESGWENMKGGIKYTSGVIAEGMDKLDGVEDWQADDNLLKSARENFKAAPKGEGILFDVGSFMPQMVGIAAATISAPLTGGTSLAALPTIIGGANIAALVATSAGGAMNTFDQYNEGKGNDGNDLARIGVGIGAGAAEYFAEKLGSFGNRYIPKGAFATAATKFLSKNTDVAEELAKKALKQNPSIGGFLKKTGKNMIEEGSEEAATEAGNILIETMYKDKEDAAGFDEWLSRLKSSAQGGALMSGMVSPISYGADVAYQNKMQNNIGPEQPSGSSGQLTDTTPQFTVNPRDTKEAELRQFTDNIVHPETGKITIVNVITPGTEENVPMFVAQTDATGGFLLKDEQGNIAKNPDGSPMFYKPVGHEGEVQEISVDDWVNGKMGEYDQEEADAQFAAENQMEFNGQILSRINRPEAKQEGFEYFYDENKQLVEVPNEDVLKWEQERQLDQNEANVIPESETIITKVNEPINNESVTTAASQDNGLKAEQPIERKITTQTIGKTPIDIIEGEEFDEVVPSDKVSLEKALPILEKEFKDNEDFNVVAERVQVEIPAENKYKKPTFQTVIKSIKIVPVAQNVNNSDQQTENIPEITDQNAVDQFDALFETENNQQINELQNEDSEKVIQPTAGIVAEEGENTPQENQGEGMQEGLEENVNIKIYRGSGGTVKSTGLSVLGNGKYFFVSQDSAKRFGESIEESEINTSELLQIDANNYKQVFKDAGISDEIINNISSRLTKEQLDEIGTKLESYAKSKGKNGILANDNVRDISNGFHLLIGMENGDGSQVVLFTDNAKSSAENVEAKKADIEKRRQEELFGNLTDLEFEKTDNKGRVRKTTVKTKVDKDGFEYKFETTSDGGSTSTSFPKTTKQEFKDSSIYENLDQYSREFIDELPEDAIIFLQSISISNDNNSAAGLGNGNIEIGYTSKGEGISLRDIVMKYQPNEINAKYDAELAALNKKSDQPSVETVKNPLPQTAGSENISTGQPATVSKTADPVADEIAQQEVNLNPTEAQKEAGNYKKGHVTIQGMDITIENPKGSVRKGIDEDGKAWENVIQSHYGYFKRTIGKDNDHIDTFIGDNPESNWIFVVDQNNPNTGKFDESKVMTGFNTIEEAKAAYLANYQPDWKGFGSITAVPVDQFKEWLLDGAKQHKPFSEYKDTPDPAIIPETRKPLNNLLEDAVKAREEKKPIITVIPNGNTAFDKQAQGFLKAFLDKGKVKDKVKFAKGKLNYDMFAVMDDNQEIIGLFDSPESAYQGALNADIESFHIVRELRDGQNISYDYYTGSLFGDYDGEMYDEKGYLKNEVKQAVIDEIKKNFNIQEVDKQFTPLPEEKQKVEPRKPLNDLLADAKDDLDEVRFSKKVEANKKSPEFQKWFGGSVFTDNGKSGGNPLVLYHGTDRNFDSFRPDRMIYLTPSAEYANMYTSGQSAKGAHYVGKTEQELAAKTYSGESVMPVFARAENPFDTRNPKHRAIFQKEYFGKYGNGAPLDPERGLPDWTDAEDLQEFFDEKGYDFDGLVLAESHGNITYAVFSPNQVKSATGNSGEFSTEDDDIRFSKKINDDPNLVVVHNLREEGLLNADRIGGLAMPSLAIVNVNHGFTSYGDITLIADKDLIDPKKNRFSKVFASDVYSARYPSIAYELSNSGSRKLLAKIQSVLDKEISSTTDYHLEEEIQGKGLKELIRSRYAQLLFLKDNGREFEYQYEQLKYPESIKQAFIDNGWKNIEYFEISDNKEVKKKITDLYLTQYDNDPEYKEAISTRLLDEDGILKGYSIPDFISRVKSEIRNAGKIDLTETLRSAEKFIEENNLRKEFEAYAKSLYSDLGVTEKIFKGFNNSGNRVYAAHTLENVLKSMKKDGIRAGESSFYGSGSVRAQVTPQFNSIKDIQAKRGSIIENFDAIKEEANSDLFELLDAIKSFYKYDSSNFGYSQNAAEELVVLSRRGSSESFNKLTPELHQQVSDYLTKLANMPTEYFEAKINRGVSIAEFKAALVPSGLSQEAKDVLKFNGVEAIEYSDQEDRKEKLKQYSEDSDIRFSKKVYHGSPHSFDRFSLDKIGTGEGAQAYGWGLYFTDRKDIAEQYADLAKRKIKEMYDNGEDMPQEAYNELDNVDFLGFDDEWQAASVFATKKSKQRVMDDYDITSDQYDSIVKALTGGRNLYFTTLHEGKEPGEYDYLRWDQLTTKQQQDKIINQADKEGILGDFDDATYKIQTEDYKMIGQGDLSPVFKDGTIFEMNGEDIYREISKLLGSDKEASLFLLRSGIDGVQVPTEYLSMGSHDKSFNYVVFDENAVTVDEHAMFAKDAEFNGKRPSIEQMQTRIDELQSIAPSAAPVTIIKSLEELPERIRNHADFNDDVEAVWFKGRIYIIPGKVSSMDNLVQIWIHENGIHNGIRNIIPSGEMKDFLNTVYDSFLEIGKTNPEFQKIIGRVNNDYKSFSNDKKAEEFLAYLSEKVVSEEELTPMEQSMWQKYLGMFRDFLRRLFNFNSQLLSEKQIVEITRFAVQSNFQENEHVSSVKRGSGSLRKGESGDVNGSETGIGGQYQDQANGGNQTDIRSGRILDENSTESGIDKSLPLNDYLLQAKQLVEQRNIEKTTAIGRERVLSFFKQAVKNIISGKSISIGKLTKSGKEYLSSISGLDFRNITNFVLNPSDLKHIYNDHYGDNEKDKGKNIPLNDDDIRSMFDVISNPDKAIFLGVDERTGTNKFSFLKKSNEGTYNVLEVYGNKGGKLAVKTFFNTKKGIDQRVVELQNSLLSTSETYSGETLSDTKVPRLIYLNKSEREDGQLLIQTPDKSEAAAALSTLPTSLSDKDTNNSELPNAILINGVSRPTLNSNGKPIANSEEGIRNFWKWFGDSKVVDSEGRPLVVYHGTRSDFDEFKTGRYDDIWFVDKQWYANQYANTVLNGNVIPAYIKIENPASEFFYNEYSPSELKTKGFDGVAYPDETNYTRYVVYSPSQIKSAIGNNGSFNPDDNNINFKKEAREPLTDKLARAKSEVEKNKADRLAAQEAKANELIEETPKSKETHYNHTLIKKKLAAFRLGYKAGGIDAILNTKLIQNEIIKYANANIPMEDAGKREIGKLLTSIKNAITPRALEAAFAQIDDMTTQVRKSTAINAISKLLNDNRPKLVSGKFVGRLDPDVYKTLDKIREIVKITDPAQLDKYIDVMDMDDVENVSLVATFGRLNEKTADEIDEALAKLSDIVTEGKLWYKAALEKRQKYNEGLRNKVVDKITGNKGLTNEQDLISSGRVVKTGSIGRFINAHINFEWLLDKISKDKTEETGRGWMQEYFGDLTTKSTNEESKGIRKQTELIHQKAAEIFGVDGKKLAQRFHENSKVVDKSGVTYINAVGERVELPLSQNQAYKKWMEWQDVNLSKTFERMGWDATTFKQLEKFILPDVKEWAEWQIKDFYANYYNGVNEKFREAYFANLGHSENYSPIKREVTDVTSGDDAMLQKAHVLASVGNQSLKARQTNVHNLLLKDGDTVLAMHIAEMEHFKAWVMEINEIRSVFNSRQVQHAIKTNFGQSVLTNLNDQIADMARGGEDRANIISFVDRIRRNFVTAELGGNISLFPKQSVSLLAYLSEVPVKNYALGLIDLAANLRTAIKTISKNEMVIERFQKGWAPEIKAAMKQDESGAFSQSRNMLGDIRNWLLFPTKAGDYAAVIGGWIVYKYEYDNQIALGKSKQESSEYALNKVDRSVSRTQQSGALKDVSQIQKGSWNKVLTMFKSSPIQQFRYENAAFRNLKNGRGSAINNAKIIAVYHFLIPMMFQFISNLFTDDDDDKERNRIIRAGLLGSANSLLIAGDIVEAVLEKVMGETWGDFAATPIEGSITKGLQGVGNIASGLKDMDKEKVLKGVDQLLYGVNNVSVGLPYRPTKKLWKQGNEILGTESARKTQGEEIFNNSRLYLQAAEDAANYNNKKKYDEITSSEWISSYRKIQGNYSENIAGLKSNINSLKKENQTVGITPEGKKQNEVYIDNNQKAIDEIYMKIADEYSKVKFPKKY